jgi:hypothetical protein
MEVDGFGSSSGEGIEGGGGKRGEARKGAFFIGFLEGEAKAAGRGRPPDSGVVLVACLFLESIAATKALPAFTLLQQRVRILCLGVKFEANSGL